MLASLARHDAVLGEKEPARAWLQRALTLAPGDPDVRFKGALVDSLFGERDRTLDSLGKALKAGLSPSAVRDEPFLDNLRADPRFQNLLAGL